MKAVSDIAPSIPNQPKSEPVENLFTLMKLVSTPDTVAHFENLYNQCEIRYGDMKKQLAEDMIAFLTPLQERIAHFRNNETLLRNVAQQGAEKARSSARQTLALVREAIGIRSLF